MANLNENEAVHREQVSLFMRLIEDFIDGNINAALLELRGNTKAQQADVFAELTISRDSLRDALLKLV